MKNVVFAFLLISFSSCETLMKSAGGIYGSGASAQEADLGIRQALTQGVGKGISLLNKTDGFFGTEAYRLFLPPDAVRIESTLRSLGLGNQVDHAILQINRAAEDAVGQATPIFSDAITGMTVADALNIVSGSKNAATSYFREKTRGKLIESFTPTIRTSLDKMDATRFYTEIVNTYNRIPTTLNKLNPDLVSYVAEKATDALFDQIEKEEANIRENPLARTTQILQKVFGTRYR
ncbi:MAG: DUF4197 domain-containing protein [Chitinophagaceae bacterium]